MPTRMKNVTFYSVSELSHKLNVTTVTIRNYLKQGKLKGQKVMGRWFISDEDAAAFFREIQLEEGLDEVYENSPHGAPYAFPELM